MITDFNLNGMEDPSQLMPFQDLKITLASCTEAALVFWAPWLQSTSTAVVFVVKDIKMIRITKTTTDSPTETD